MKVRESGMPEQEYWESLLAVTAILDALQVDRTLKDAVEVGCGYGTFTVPVAQRIGGTLYTFDIEPAMVAQTGARVAAAGLANVDLQLRDVIAGRFALPAATMDAVLLFNILHAENPVQILLASTELLRAGGRLLVIHWRSDLATPRGPDLAIRPRPEQIAAWATVAGKLELETPAVNVGPWHFAMAFRRAKF